MRTGLIARKLGMTRVFTDEGTHVPVTVLQVESCQVVAVRTEDRDGYTAVQLGVEAGAVVTGTARHHHQELLELGATDIEASGSYDVILELVGGDNLRTNLERLNLKGRIAVIGVGAGATAQVHFGRLMAVRGRIHGSTLRPRSREEKAGVIRSLHEDVLPLLSAGRVVVPVHATYPLDRAQEAYDAFAAGGKFGKIVLLP